MLQGNISDLGSLNMIGYGLAAIGPGITFVECVVGKYLTEPAGTPMPTVVADEIVACGGDAASVVRALDAHEAPALHAGVAHASAK